MIELVKGRVLHKDLRELSFDNERTIPFDNLLDRHLKTLEDFHGAQIRRYENHYLRFCQQLRVESLDSVPEFMMPYLVKIFYTRYKKDYEATKITYEAVKSEYARRQQTCNGSDD